MRAGGSGRLLVRGSGHRGGPQLVAQVVRTQQRSVLPAARNRGRFAPVPLAVPPRPGAAACWHILAIRLTPGSIVMGATTGRQPGETSALSAHSLADGDLGEMLSGRKAGALRWRQAGQPFCDRHRSVAVNDLGISSWVESQIHDLTGYRGVKRLEGGAHFRSPNRRTPSPSSSGTRWMRISSTSPATRH
jgi:hypothetical protein